MADDFSQFHIDLLTACEEDWQSAAGVYSLALSAGLDDPVATRALARLWPSVSRLRPCMRVGWCWAMSPQKDLSHGPATPGTTRTA